MILSTLQQWYKNFRAVMAMPITAVPLPLLRRKKSARARRLRRQQVEHLPRPHTSDTRWRAIR